MNTVLPPQAKEAQSEQILPDNREAMKALLAETRSEIYHFASVMNPLLVLRHDLFVVDSSDFSGDIEIRKQLYNNPMYNDSFFGSDMGLRKGNTLDYHQTTEKYDDSSDEAFAERNRIYRQAIMTGAQELGFIATKPGKASSKIDQDLGILDSELKPIGEKVAATVINAAAGSSNLKRVRDALRNIESGAVDTDMIILSGGTRPVGDAEKSRVVSGYRAGDTEFELIRNAAEDLTGASFDTDMKYFDVSYGNGLKASYTSMDVAVGDRVVKIIAIEAPYDTERTMDDGSPAKRINTEEAFLSSLPFIEGVDGAIVMESHDTWTPWQKLIAQKIFTIPQGRTVYQAGPFNQERIFWSDEDESQMDIAGAQDVVDEMVKTYRQLVRLSLETESALASIAK